MRTLMWLKQMLDYLGGAADEPPVDSPKFLTGPIFLGLWWGALIIMVVLFSGQTSKFIYIDF
jgi:hypothetical protein